MPPDNNGSERAIRNIKVITKVSTQFGTFYGAQNLLFLAVCIAELVLLN